MPNNNMIESNCAKGTYGIQKFNRNVKIGQLLTFENPFIAGINHLS